MAKKDVEGLSSSGEGVVRRPASVADILGRKPGSKVKAPPTMLQTKPGFIQAAQVPTRQPRTQKVPAAAIFGPEAARQRSFSAMPRP